MSDQSESTQPAPAKITLEVTDIHKILPHRYPFLLIDRVVELIPGKRIVALKSVTANEEFFQGHFPGMPLMPGVLIIESMAQAGGVLLLSDIPDRDQKLMVFSGIEKAKFRRPVVPGDQLRLEVEVLAWRHNTGRMEGTAWVGDKRACEATLSCVVTPRPGAGTPEVSEQK